MSFWRLKVKGGSRTKISSSDTRGRPPAAEMGDGRWRGGNHCTFNWGPGVSPPPSQNNLWVLDARCQSTSQQIFMVGRDPNVRIQLCFVTESTVKTDDDRLILITFCPRRYVAVPSPPSHNAWSRAAEALDEADGGLSGQRPALSEDPAAGAAGTCLGAECGEAGGDL